MHKLWGKLRQLIKLFKRKFINSFQKSIWGERFLQNKCHKASPNLAWLARHCTAVQKLYCTSINLSFLVMYSKLGFSLASGWSALSFWMDFCRPVPMGEIVKIWFCLLPCYVWHLEGGFVAHTTGKYFITCQ